MTSTCSSLCGNGTKCRCRALEGSDYCGRHKNSNECSVCYDSSILKPMAKCCHSVCKSCTKSWFATHTTCPLCRTVQSKPKGFGKFTKIYKRAPIRWFLKRQYTRYGPAEASWTAFFDICYGNDVEPDDFMKWFESGGRREEFERVNFGWGPDTIHEE